MSGGFPKAPEKIMVLGLESSSSQSLSLTSNNLSV